MVELAIRDTFSALESIYPEAKWIIRKLFSKPVISAEEVGIMLRHISSKPGRLNESYLLYNRVTYLGCSHAPYSLSLSPGRQETAANLWDVGVFFFFHWPSSFSSFSPSLGMVQFSWNGSCLPNFNQITLISVLSVPKFFRSIS